MKPTITVTISPTGEISVEGNGFKGAACDAALAEIERALGMTEKVTRKAEWYQGAGTPLKKQQRMEGQ